ncbi:MAG: GxxExxY protein [Flavobacteriales bacterium]|nr:GxxExxY protein [Flavobacteriales bacterium]PCH85451.1 MAG: GxxExxY protein [Flavobacteriales bacterium]
MRVLERDDLIYPELSYDIVGCAYDVYNDIGPGHLEKYYQKAMAVAFKLKGLTFEEQLYHPLEFKGEVIGRTFLDFVVENKVVVELKRSERYSKSHMDQVLNYLKITDLKLALLINFSNTEVSFKRVLNSK